MTASWFAVDRYREGDRLPLVHPPGKPLAAQVHWCADTWGRPLFLLAVAAALLAIGWVLARSLERHRKKESSMTLQSILAVLLLAAPAAAALAQRGERPWAEEVADFGIRSLPARVKKSVPQAFFYRDGGGCSRAAAECRRPVSVPSGGEVVVFLYEGSTPRFVRALYRATTESPLVAGLMSSAELDIVESVSAPRAAALAGFWHARIHRVENEARLRLRPAQGRLEFEITSELLERGVPIPGSMRRETKGLLRATSDPYLTYSAPARGGKTCTLFFVPLGRYLLVHDDEDRCADGGETVRYTGLYLREAAPAAPPAAAPVTGALPAIAGYTLEPNRSRAETAFAYRNISRGEVTIESCARACSGDRACVAFTLLPGVPGVSGPDCRLLELAGSPQERQGAVSGLRKK